MELKLNYSNFDMYSKRLGFYFKNQEKVGSYFGLFLSLAYVIISLVLLFEQIFKAIKRDELNVYDSTIYTQEMPNIIVNSDDLYFAFGLEDPLTSNRFMDEGIYIPKVAFVEKVKINDELVTVNTTQLPLERCNVSNFGENYQHLFTQDELNSSYCLKNPNYTLNFLGGYKYEKFNYLRLRIYPCVNSSNNNNSCKPQEEIDRFLASGYYSILIKDFGLNPSNYSYPVVPTFQDLYTTIDKKIYRNYILNFGITEVHTDVGIINQDIEKKSYFQFRKELQTFTFRDEQEYYNGKSIILVQFKLDDSIIIQKRSYTKIAEIFSRIGGYMQLMNTVFLLISSLVNKLNFDLKIINNIFKFNVKENRIILKLQTLKDIRPNPQSLANQGHRNSYFTLKKPDEEKKSFGSENRSKINLIMKDKDSHYISDLNLSNNIIMNESHKNSGINLDKNENENPMENQKINIYSLKTKLHNKNSDNIRSKLNVEIRNKDKEKLSIRENHEDINLNFLDYFCVGKSSKKYKNIQLYNRANRFYRKKMDLIHIFSLLSFIEEYFKKEFHNYN